MNDDADMASRQEEAARAEAVRRALAPLKGRGRKTCEDCGEPIPKKRKKALPSATRCVSCQQTADRQRRLYTRR